MALTTTSGYSILNGTCEISGNTCTSYTSTSNGAGTISSLPSTPGFTLHFSVSFTGVARPYHIKANASGDDYTGEANDGVKRQDETWAATATQPAVAAKAN